MKWLNGKFGKLVSIMLLLPLYGCQGGGGGIAGLFSSLFNGGSSGGIGQFLGGIGGFLPFSTGGGGGTGGSLPPGIVGEAGVATITNPEPASMLLVGGGMMAMAYYKNRKQDK